jgi:uncharacterized membrane protein
MQTALDALLWFSAIGCGLMAGVYFVFSAFAMTAFARLDDATGRAAMNEINVVILRSAFLPLFFGTTLAALALAVLALLDWSAPGMPAALTGGALYVAGMFCYTALVNVPLNNELARAGDTAAAGTWRRYRVRGTRWNHLRTLASTLASALFVVAIAARAAST